MRVIIETGRVEMDMIQIHFIHVYIFKRVNENIILKIERHERFEPVDCSTLTAVALKGSNHFLYLT